jgi:hypothetical protein
MSGMVIWVCYHCGKSGVGPWPVGHELTHGYIDGGGI